ncbi:MAG: hypothetical protein LBG60_14775 [Bifidobacteriaceae bacterium]|jgi:Flp pilus assembly protein CpaB|nr:hypothetical protein [Bifidobacteriaceae bacterium]
MEAARVAAGWRPDGPPETSVAADRLIAARDQGALAAQAAWLETDPDQAERLMVAAARLERWRDQMRQVAALAPEAELADCHLPR